MTHALKTDPIDKNILHLTLKKQWYDMIESGVKTEEYREIKRYWQTRIQINGYHRFEFKKFDIITFKNGYQKDARTMSFKFEGIEIGKGVGIWGAEPNEKYFKIKIGQRIN